MGALDTVEWETCLLEPVRNPDAERYLRKSLGFVSPGARYFLDSPWLIRAFAALDVVHVPLVHVGSSLAGMIALVVSQENSCRYCYTATRTLMLILGFPEERIRSLEGDATELKPEQRATLDFARCVARGVPLATCRDARPLLDAGMSPEQLKEIAFLAVANVFYNRLSTLPALPPAPMEYRWYERLFRPFIAAKLRQPPARPQPLAVEERQGPFAAFVNALSGLPAASRLRRVIDEALQPSALSRRIKGLVFAVVARGIGCPQSERDATDLLVAEGLTPAQVEHILAHLSGPELDPLEQAAASLARESIWYQPAPLQRHVRSIRPLFTHEQFVELIGLTALANSICRLSVAVDIERQAA